ncbi:hypothetical protein [Sphingomonas sp. Y38-1Y]|uniref:hypothetical protein n=1 Tax=Sphingomonas sp. Y38-1Y TaxID=3078265 RepID=UPI0028EEFC9B|nr:hypothetical protein [Sphingomonas sp. Y38-1Y]
MIGLAALLAAQMPPIGVEPQETIIKLAFDPARLFGNRSHALVEIQYLGDDYAFPVYAIAIQRDCVGKRGPNCQPTLIARMVRAPNAKTVERPRWAGAAIVGRVKQAGAKTADQVALVLDELELDWLEADLSSCPGAMAVVPDAERAEWVPPAVTRPKAIRPIEMFLHFDKVTVSFAGDYTRKTTFSGRIADHLPSGWAIRLAAALEPCWRPATEPPPWRRAATPRPPAAPAALPAPRP